MAICRHEVELGDVTRGGKGRLDLRLEGMWRYLYPRALVAGKAVACDVEVRFVVVVQAMMQ